jgi:hypothetical protein
LGGFDVCAFMLRTLEDISTVIDRCAALGIEHGEVHDRGDFGIALDIADPDGTMLRLWPARTPGLQERSPVSSSVPGRRPPMTSRGFAFDFQRDGGWTQDVSAHAAIRAQARAPVGV